MRIFYQIPDWLRRWIYPEALWRGKSAASVYLTFDDGPIPEVTPNLLDMLDQLQVKATFFWVGENLTKYPHLAEEILRRGHRVGNHTYHHVSGWKTPLAEYQQEILQTQEKIDAIYASVGIEPPREKLFRPPYGKAGQRMHRWLKEQGYKVVLWDIVSHDYNTHYTPERVLQIVMNYVRPGSIILMHDSLKSQLNMLENLPTIVRRLRLKGYQFDLL